MRRHSLFKLLVTNKQTNKKKTKNEVIQTTDENPSQRGFFNFIQYILIVKVS